MARAAALHGNEELYQKHYTAALASAEKISKAADKTQFLSDLKGGNWHRIEVKK